MSASRASYAAIAMGPPPEPNIDTLIAEYEGVSIHGWHKLYEKLKECGDIFGPLVFEHFQVPQHDIYDAVRSKAKTFSVAATFAINESTRAMRSGRNAESQSLMKKAQILKTMAMEEQKKNCIILFDWKHQARGKDENAKQAKGKDENAKQTLHCHLHDLLPDEAVMVVQIHIWFALHLRSVRLLDIIMGIGNLSNQEFLKAKRLVKSVLDRKKIHFTSHNNGEAFLVKIEDIPRSFKLD